MAHDTFINKIDMLQAHKRASSDFLPPLLVANFTAAAILSYNWSIDYLFAVVLTLLAFAINVTFVKLNPTIRFLRTDKIDALRWIINIVIIDLAVSILLHATIAVLFCFWMTVIIGAFIDVYEHSLRRLVVFLGFTSALFSMWKTNPDTSFTTYIAFSATGLLTLAIINSIETHWTKECLLRLNSQTRESHEPVELDKTHLSLAGANEFLEKPFMPIAALTAIRTQESELIADKSKNENFLISELLIDLGQIASISAQPITERAACIITKISDFLNAEWAAIFVFKPDSNSVEFTSGTKKFEQFKAAARNEFLNHDEVFSRILAAEIGAFTTRLVTENGKALGILVISKSTTDNSSKTASEALETGLVNRLGVLFSSLRTQWLAGDNSHELSDHPLLRLAMIGEVSSSLMHDIANPLQIVSSYSETLRKRTDIGQEAMVYVEKLAIRVRNLVNIFNMFQHLNVVGASKQKRDILADDIVRTATLSLENKISLYKVKISTDIAADLNVFCETQAITQVVVNLISNAIDASRTSLNTEILIRVTKPEEKVTLFEVSNYGPPIPPEIRDKIFSMFYTTKSEGKGKGTGLGLYISNKFVKDHGGEINHRRGSDGRTIFYFTIKES